MENAGYLFAAFIIIWVVIFGYILLLFNRQKRLRQDLKSLRETIKEKHLE